MYFATTWILYTDMIFFEPIQPQIVPTTYLLYFIKIYIYIYTT